MMRAARLRGSSAAVPAALPLDFDAGLLAAAAGITLSIGLAAGLAALHAHVVSLPRGVFLLAQVLTALLIVVLIALWVQRKLVGQRPGAAVMGALPMLAFAWIAVGMMLSGFARHDEIYSWNLWAIQHFLREPYDRTYTQAAYPQLYAYWLASIYAAQAGFESQLLTRFASAVPALVLLGVAGAFWPLVRPGDPRGIAPALLVTPPMLFAPSLFRATRSSSSFWSIALLCKAARSRWLLEAHSVRH